MPNIDVHDLRRLRRIAAVLARHGFGSALRFTGLLHDEPVAGAAGGSPWAVRLREVLVELGPTYVKLGQVLSVRPDIVTQDLVAELQKLQDDVPPVAWSEARAVVERELGQPCERVFASIDPEPVASASIAQVHLATLRDGTRVAVKVQRPGIAEVIRSDLHILYSLARLVEGRIELPGLHTPAGIVREFEQAMHQELDFFQEARNATRFRRNFRELEGIRVPGILDDHTTTRLLVMERIEGRPISALEPGDPASEQVVSRLVEATLRQVFDHGFFHADPHPGNIFLLPSGELAWLDFGLCGVLTPDMRDTLLEAFAAVVFRDGEALARTIHRAGGVAGRVDLRAFRAEISRLLERYHGASMAQLSQRATLVEFIEAATRFHIQLPAEYALLARAASLVDGIARRLVPDADMVEMVRPHARRLLAERMAPDRVAADLLRLVVQSHGTGRDLPAQVGQLLSDLERGHVVIRAEDPDAALLRRAVHRAAFQVSLALCATALLLFCGLALSGLHTGWGSPPLRSWLALVSGVGAVTLWVGLVYDTLLGEHLPPARWPAALVRLLRFFAPRSTGTTGEDPGPR